MKLITGTVAALIATGTLSACGNDTSTPEAEAKMPIEEWVAEFDTKCVEMATTLSDPAITDEEFAEISAAGIAEMRALPAPESMAGEVASLLAAIDATSTDLTLTDDEITAFDDQFLAAATTLGVSDECLYGAGD